MVEASGGSQPSVYALPRQTLVATGPDRKTWLDGLVTCNVAEVAPGTAVYGLLLTKQGKIVSDVVLADSGTELFIGVAPSLGGSVHELLDRYLVMEDAELAPPTAAIAWQVSLQAELASGAQPLASGQLVLGTLRLQLSLVPQATPASSDDAELAALLAAHGLGVFGVDFGERDNPHEASLDRIAVSWTKGCYLGQEVVCMQDMRGKVKRRLVALEGGAGLLGLHAGGPVASPDVLAADGSVVGHVSSVHPAASGGARLLASISTSVLESTPALTVLGEPVRVVAGSQA